MANILEVFMQSTIKHLARQGWSIRRIARELGINRRTVAKYTVEFRETSKCTTPETRVPAGNLEKCTTLATRVPAGNLGKCTTLTTRVPAGKSIEQSSCIAYRTIIEELLQAGLSAQRIYQDLRNEHGFIHSYDSVKRYVRKLRAVQELPFRRLESLPGEEVQIDYGTGYWLEYENGKRRKAHVLRVTLSFSRKSYSEASLSQSTENFIRCIENAFRFFGGSSKLLVIDISYSQRGNRAAERRRSFSGIG